MGVKWLKVGRTPVTRELKVWCISTSSTQLSEHPAKAWTQVSQPGFQHIGCWAAVSLLFFFFFFFFSKMYFADCSLYYFHNQPLDAVIVTNSTQQRNIVPLLQNWIMTLGHLQDKPLDKVLGCTTGNPQIQCRPC